MDNSNTWTVFPAEESIRMTEDRDKMEKVRPWCGPTLGSRTAKEQNTFYRAYSMALKYENFVDLYMTLVVTSI